MGDFFIGGNIMSGIALYVETDGQSENAVGAIEDAAVSKDSIPFDEGDIVEVQIDATWTTPDGKHHARVSLIKTQKPVLDEKQMAQSADNANHAPANNLSEPPEPEQSEESPDVEVAHDGLTDNDPNNTESSALELTPDMQDAEEELEDDFQDARNPHSERNKALKDKPESDRDVEAEEESQYEKEKRELEHNSEGLRRIDAGNEKFKPKKDEPF